MVDISGFAITKESLAGKEISITIGYTSNTTLEHVSECLKKRSNAPLWCCCFCIHKDNRQFPLRDCVSMAANEHEEEAVSLSS